MIDTAGPALSAEAEQGGLAGEIARCLAELVTLDTPTVSVLLGQGSGGPALAMVPADRVLAALHGWLAPLPPEGASAIVYRDVDHAPELAAAQGIRSVDLLRDGIVDVVVPEHPDAADEPVEFTKRLSATIAGELHRLRAIPDEQRLDARLTRYRRIGLPRLAAELGDGRVEDRGLLRDSWSDRSSAPIRSSRSLARSSAARPGSAANRFPLRDHLGSALDQYQHCVGSSSCSSCCTSSGEIVISFPVPSASAAGRSVRTPAPWSGRRGLLRRPPARRASAYAHRIACTAVRPDRSRVATGAVAQDRDGDQHLDHRQPVATVMIIDCGTAAFTSTCVM